MTHAARPPVAKSPMDSLVYRLKTKRVERPSQNPQVLYRTFNFGLDREISFKSIGLRSSDPLERNAKPDSIFDLARYAILQLHSWQELQLHYHHDIRHEWEEFLRPFCFSSSCCLHWQVECFPRRSSSRFQRMC